MPISNPFELVYDAIWGLVDNHKGLSDLIRFENRVNFNNPRNRDPVKTQVAARDLPELRLIATGATYATETTSCSTKVTQQFQWGIATGDKRFEQVFQVNWELLRAMMKWRETLQALLWNNKRFVFHVSPIEHSVGVTDVDLNRGIKGWSALWTGEVQMFFTSADLAGDT